MRRKRTSRGVPVDLLLGHRSTSYLLFPSNSAGSHAPGGHHTRPSRYWTGAGNANFPGNSTSAGIRITSLAPFPDGAAARSMSESWHDFIFGAFDPAGTVTVDKLPGELWLQALSLRVFGFHIWALVLPQVVEGVLTILVLYRAVRRLAGPAAGL